MSCILMAPPLPVGPLRRLGIIMEPDLTDPREAEGVLNPAVARGPDSALYLLPRLVGPGNYSRIGLARVCFDSRGDPSGVERLGVVLEPEEPYELNARMGGGVEDPRVTYIAARGLYVMTYTALGPTGPRIAAAVSRDLLHWRRLGPVRFASPPGHALKHCGTCDNKDALLFPEPVQAPDGRSALALIHRPVFTASPDRPASPVVAGHCDHRPSMWISYAPLDEIAATRHVVFGQHHRLAGPAQDWERLKVGGGTPPVRTCAGWLLLYHGVTGSLPDEADGPMSPRDITYSAGVMLLDGRDPRRVLYRSAHSVLQPRVAAERVGIVPRVVFPTGLDVRADGALDVYYGMADSRIGVARAALADLLMPAMAQVA